MSARINIAIDLMQRAEARGRCWCDQGLSHPGWLDCLEAEMDRIGRYHDILREEEREQTAAKAGPIMVGTEPLRTMGYST